MRQVVLATAGHVDHGKSTLVRALTGRDPDRLSEEQRRGLTIDLGFAWTDIDDVQVAFVDVPGHSRFIGTMLAGLGPAPGVLFVVAADQGWQAQSSEHLAAVDALGIEHGLLIVTRADLADPAMTQATLTTAREHLAASSLAGAQDVVVSAREAPDLETLRRAIRDVITVMPAPRVDAPSRIWVDRAFTIGGAGTVVTGTLGEGRLTAGDQLLLLRSHQPEDRPRSVTVRGLQSRDERRSSIEPVARVALNLRGVSTEEIARGDVLLRPDAFALGRVIDLACADAKDLPEAPTLHVGAADLVVQARPLGTDHVRVTLPANLPWRVGDRVILRDPGQRRLWGGRVLDVDPAPLRRRGAARSRAADLAAAGGDTSALLTLRVATGLLDEEAARRLGLLVDPLPVGVERHGSWLASSDLLADLVQRLRDLVAAHQRDDALSPGLLMGEAAGALGIPLELVAVIADRADLSLESGRLRDPGATSGLGSAEVAVAAVEERLATDAFDAPEREDLAVLGLGRKEIAAAVRLGRLLRLAEDIVLRPDAPARAMRILADLPQPFTTSDARQALGTTRRVAIPLLEHLDDRGWTRRIDAQHREVVR